MSTPTKILMFLFFISASMMSKAVTMYKWIQPNGTPHYSQNRPTSGISQKNIKIIQIPEYGQRVPIEQPIGTTLSDPNAAADANLTPEQKRIKELETQNKAQQDQQNKERCKSLQNNLQNLNAGGRVYEMDDKGERKYLDNREMELRKQKVADAVSQYCK